MKNQLRIRTLLITVAVFGMVVITGCDRSSEPVKGFVLPKGDIEAGKRAFVEIGCTQCHNIDGVEAPATTGEKEFDVKLGGKIRHVKNYGELLTSVVNPDHRVGFGFRNPEAREDKQAGDSPMPIFSEQMTVAQLINIVEFLNSAYESQVPTYSGRRYSYGL